MIILDLVQIIIVVLLIIIPLLLMAWLVRIRPIYQLAQRSKSMRTWIVLGNGLLYFIILYGTLLWLVSYVFLAVAAYYAHASPASNREAVAVVNEIWLRQIVSGGTAQACFSGNPAICRLADNAFGLGGAPDESLNIVLIPLLLSTLAVLLLSWRFTKPIKTA